MSQIEREQEDFTTAHCYELMPEWRGLDLRIGVLVGGITNKLYRVDLPSGEAYVVRIYGYKTDLFIDREVEAENIRLMEATGVVPKLVKFLPEKSVTIVKYIPGVPLKNADFLDEDLLASIVRPITLIHHSGKRLPKLFDPLQEVIALYRILKNIGKDYPEFRLNETIEILGRLSELADVPHASYLPCHNDLLADNFILADDQLGSQERMYLIDWEYAGMSTPYYELGDMFQEILVPRQIEEKIIRIYWDDTNIDEHTFKTDIFKPFPDIYWFLWSLIQLNISKIEFDYYNYGKVKYENAWNNIRFLKEHYGLKIELTTN
jgi:thiamine kinase-like enzyme